MDETKILIDEMQYKLVASYKINFILNAVDEIFDNCYLGDGAFACNIKYLKQFGISYVLNAAQGLQRSQINTNENFYKPFGIKFFGCNLMDTNETNIREHFEPALRFMHEALQNGSSILIHCYQGISRSATFVLAYMMKYKQMTLMDALMVASKRRYIYPNDGFLRQLIQYEAELQSMDS